MGIPLPDSAFNNECPLCFPANQTPIVVYAAITGVLIGSTWTSDLGEAPNGVWTLESTTGCIWSKTIGDWTATYSVISGRTLFAITAAVAPDKFFDNPGSECVTQFVNDITSSSAPFYNGIATVGWKRPLIKTSIVNVADQVGIISQAGTFAEFFPFDADENVYRFANIKERLNVQILFDIT